MIGLTSLIVRFSIFPVVYGKLLIETQPCYSVQYQHHYADMFVSVTSDSIGLCDWTVVE